jgi:hypothetical protein
MKDDEIIAFIESNLPVARSIITFKKTPLLLESSFKDDLGVSVEECEDFLEAFFAKFSIDGRNFDLSDYYPWTGIPFIPRFLTPKKLRQQKLAKPLTVRMLLESAKAGRWLY